MQLAAPASAAERPLRLVELPVPQPGPGEVLLKVHACGVCRTDLHILEGELPPHRSPVVPGHQIVGEVVAFGELADAIAPGGEPAAPPLALGERVGVPWLHQDRRDLPLLPARRREPLRARPVHRLGRRRRLRRVHGRAGRLRLPTAGRDGRPGRRSPAVRRHHRLPLPSPDRRRRRRTRACPGAVTGVDGARSACPASRSWSRNRTAGRTGRRRTSRRRGAPPMRRLGIYGFGSAASLCTQVAIWRGWEVYGFARDEEHRSLARELGAVWAGESGEDPGVVFDAAIVFAPAGELAVDALRRLDKGGDRRAGRDLLLAHPAHRVPVDLPRARHPQRRQLDPSRTRASSCATRPSCPCVSRVQEYEPGGCQRGAARPQGRPSRGSAVLRIGESGSD